MAFPSRQPIASTSRLPPAGPFSHSYHTLPRSLRLTPSTRTRLTNLSFITAALLSIATVSLGMSGSVKVNGVGLPCPARREAGVALDGNNEGEWKVEGRKERRKRRWLEDPVPIAKQEAVNTFESRPAVGSRELSRREEQQTQGSSGNAEQAGERIAGGSKQQQQGWGSWAKSMLG